MNAKTTMIAAALALIAGAASAAEAVQLPAAERGQLTRAEVQAELARARAAGELVSSGDSYGLQWANLSPGRAVPSALARPREDVRSEARRAARRGGVENAYVGG